MVRLKPRALKFAYLIEALIVAGPPIGLLALQWGLVLRTVLFPESTCWIATAEEKFLLSTEVPLFLLFPGAVTWLPIAIITAGLAFFVFGRGFGRRLVIGTAFGAVVSVVLLYFGTNLAAGLEWKAFIEFRENC